MSAERFARVEALFEQAFALPPAARQRFLEESEPDAGIRDEVRRLLAHSERERSGQTGSFDEVIARARPYAAAARGDERIGPFRLLHELGAGGMGQVFLAEREVEGTVQRVALKLLHGLPTERERQRLGRERELLAGLHHPYIAGLVDGGQTGDGQPWLAMAYVEGMPLHDYLAARTPALADRLALFGKCCDAVQHAHQRLVLHRDIKPGNILVGDDGTPVLLDFGLGKLLEDGDAERTATLAFTPGYAAPEQMHGQPATTATDVFGLGAVLFDLLADVRLSSLRRGDTPVPAPSAHVADAARRRVVRGDLDRIVLRATAGDPEQRYASVATLAEDVQRYLRGEPILAGPDAFGYRVRKFVGRHRWGVAAGIVVVLMAGVFVWRLDAERQRARQAEIAAEREANDARAARDFLVSMLGAIDPDELGGKAPTIDTLLSRATLTLRADKTLPRQVRVVGWLGIGEIHASLGRPQDALAALQEAGRAAGKAGHADIETRARVLELRSRVMSHLFRHDEASKAARALIALREREGGDAGALARAHRLYASEAANTRRFDEAEEHLRRAFGLLDRAGSQRDDVLRLEMLTDAMYLKMMQGDYDGADRYLAQVRPLAASSLAPDAPAWRRIRSAAAGIGWALGRYPEALRESELALEALRRLYGEHSRSYVVEKMTTAGILERLGRGAEALFHLQEAREIGEQLQLGDAMLGRLDLNIAAQYDLLGRDRDMVAAIDSALRLLPADDPAQLPWRLSAYEQRATALARLGEFTRAWPDFEQALRLAVTIGPESQQHAQAQRFYAQALLDAGRLEDSRRAFRSYERIIRAEGNGLDEGPSAKVLRARIQQASGEQAAAKASVEDALRDIRAAGANIAPANAAILRYRAARVLFDQGDIAAARALLGEAMPVMERDLASDAPMLRAARELRARTGAASGSGRT